MQIVADPFENLTGMIQQPSIRWILDIRKGARRVKHQVFLLLELNLPRTLLTAP